MMSPICLANRLVAFNAKASLPAFALALAALFVGLLGGLSPAFAQADASPKGHPAVTTWQAAIQDEHRDRVDRADALLNAAMQRAESLPNTGAEDAKALADLRKVIAGRNLSIEPSDLIGDWRVRVFKLDRLGTFSYPFFKARFERRPDGELFFAKTTGSQRRSGFVLPRSITSMVFLGGFTVNDDPQRTYPSFTDSPMPESPGSSWNSAGIIYRKAKNRLVMILDADEAGAEVYELRR